MSVSILLADDHRLMREGLRTLIGRQPNMTVIAEAKDGEAAVELAVKLQPDVIIMDISMPGLNGIEATRQILSVNTVSKVIALSMHLESRKVLEMLNAGASGYVLKDCAFDEVIHAIGTVASNCTYLSKRVLDRVLKDYVYRTQKDGLASLSGLTPREREILKFLSDGAESEKIASLLNISVYAAEAHLHQLTLNHIVPRFRKDMGDRTIYLTSREKEILRWVKDGKSTWDISFILGISQDTVKFHLKKIFQKFNANSRSQVIALAIELKLIDC